MTEKELENLKDFLIEKSGQVMSDGVKKEEADKFASSLAFEVLGYEKDFCLEILEKVL